MKRPASPVNGEHPSKRMHQTHQQSLTEPKQSSVPELTVPSLKQDLSGTSSPLDQPRTEPEKVKPEEMEMDDGEGGDTPLFFLLLFFCLSHTSPLSLLQILILIFS